MTTFCILFELSTEWIWINIKDLFCLSRHVLPAIALYPTQQTENVYIFVIANIQSFTSQIFGVVGPLGENLDLFKPLGIEVQTNPDHKTKKIKLYLVKALKRYLNEENLIHGRVMATISKFSPQIFKMYFRKFLFTLLKVFLSIVHWLIDWLINKNYPNVHVF